MGASVRERHAHEGDFHWVGVQSCYRALADYTAQDDVFIAFAANVRTGAIDLLRRDIPRIVAGAVVGPAEVPKVEAFDAPSSSLESIVGSYEVPGEVLDLRLDGGDVLLGEWALIPVGRDRFFSPMDYAQVTVTRDETGRAQALMWAIGEKALACRRVR